MPSALAVVAHGESASPEIMVRGAVVPVAVLAEVALRVVRDGLLLGLDVFVVVQALLGGLRGRRGTWGGSSCVAAPSPSAAFSSLVRAAVLARSPLGGGASGGHAG